MTEVYTLTVANTERSANARARRVMKEERKVMKIPTFKRTQYRVGKRFPKVAVGAFHAGEIDGFSLSQLLGMNLTRLPLLESSLFPYRTIDETRLKL